MAKDKKKNEEDTTGLASLFYGRANNSSSQLTGSKLFDMLIGNQLSAPKIFELLTGYQVRIPTMSRVVDELMAGPKSRGQSGDPFQWLWQKATGEYNKPPPGFEPIMMDPQMPPKTPSALEELLAKRGQMPTAEEYKRKRRGYSEPNTLS